METSIFSDIGDSVTSPKKIAPSLAETGGKMLPQLGGENDTCGHRTEQWSFFSWMINR